MSGIEIIFLSANPTTSGAARKQFDQQFPTVAAWTNSADLLAYFELRKDLDTAGFRGRSQAVLDTMKRLRRTFPTPASKFNIRLGWVVRSIFSVVLKSRFPPIIWTIPTASLR